MTHLKLPTIRKASIRAVALVFLCTILFTGTFFLLPAVNKAEAATNDCSDVYTPLESFVVNGVSANKSFYVQAMNATGVPWEMLAAIHYRETNFSHTEPGNGQGTFQDGYAVASPGKTLTDSQFYQEVKRAAQLIQSVYALRNSPNPGAYVTPRALKANEQDINLVKNTLYSWNGRATAYAQQAANYGYDPSTVPYEGSPYVMNRFDCPRARMGIITQDYGSIDGTDTRYGTFTIFARLRGDSYWLSMTEPYSWIINSKEIYVDPNRTVSANTTLLAANTTYYMRVTARNFGNTTWTNTGSYPVKLGTTDPRDRMSSFCDSSWLKCNRPALLKEASVAPGEIGTFEFSIETPATYGTYSEHFSLLAENKTWMNDPGLAYSLTIAPPTRRWRPTAQAAYNDAAHDRKFSGNTIHLNPGQTAYVQVNALNTGNTTWTNAGTNPVRLGTTDPSDRTSIFCDSSWISCNRPAQLNEASVLPGQTGTLTFTFTAPQTLGNYDENFNLLYEHLSWLKNPGLHFFIDVNSPIQPMDTHYMMKGGDTITAGQSLMSQDGKSVLEVQQNGSIRLYNDFSNVWSTVRSGNKNHLDMQTDGNLVLYSSTNKPLWDTETNNNPGAYLYLQTDGNLVIYDSTNKPLWASSTGRYPYGLNYVNSRTSSTAHIVAGQKLETANQQFRLVVQGDGNVVLYNQYSKPLWATNTSKHPGAYLDIQSDGNTVVYDKDGSPLWSSRTNGKSVSQLYMQPDGNLVLYDNNMRPVWTSNTARETWRATDTNSLKSGSQLTVGKSLTSTNGAYQLVLQGDGNLVLYDKDNHALWATNTNNKPVVRASLQTDGNLVLYDSEGHALWTSHTAGTGNNTLLFLKDSGQLTLYDSYGNPVWSVNDTQSSN